MAATSTIEGLLAMRHRDVHDAGGEKIGELVEVYIDKATGVPEWLAVDAGLFGMKRVLVPAMGASIEPGAIRVAFTKDAVLHTPDVLDEQVSQDVEQTLYEHYGMRYSFERSPTGLPASDGRADAQAEAARWPDVPEPITQRPVRTSQSRHHIARRAPGRSATERVGRLARTAPEAPLDLRIASVLLLAVSVAKKRERALARQRAEAMTDRDEAGSPMDRIKPLVKRS